MNHTFDNCFSCDVLVLQIKSDLYQKQVLSDKSNNFQRTLVNLQSDLAIAITKDSYILKLYC